MQNQQRKIDLEPIDTFFEEAILPKEFAELLDEFVYDYVLMYFRVQFSDSKDKTVHENTEQFIFYVKLFRDVLRLCEK